MPDTQEEPVQVDDLSMRFTRFASTDVELDFFGNSSSSVLDFYNNTALQTFGAVLRGDVEVNVLLAMTGCY